MFGGQHDSTLLLFISVTFYACGWGSVSWAPDESLVQCNIWQFSNSYSNCSKYIRENGGMGDICEFYIVFIHVTESKAEYMHMELF